MIFFKLYWSYIEQLLISYIMEICLATTGSWGRKNRHISKFFLFLTFSPILLSASASKQEKEPEDSWYPATTSIASEQPANSCLLKPLTENIKMISTEKEVLALSFQNEGVLTRRSLLKKPSQFSQASHFEKRHMGCL